MNDRIETKIPLRSAAHVHGVLYCWWLGGIGSIPTGGGFWLTRCKGDCSWFRWEAA